MELRQYAKIAWRWWWLILLPPLLVGAYGLATYRAPAGAFSAALRFTAGQPEPPLVGGQAASASPNYDPNYYRWLTSEYLVAGLRDWVRTGAFAEAVRAELLAQGVDLPAGAIQGALAADHARSLLTVYLTWGDADQLTALAGAVSAVLQTRSAQAFPQLGGQPAVVVPLDTPGVVPLSASLRARLDLPLKVGVALAAGVVLALLAHYFDPFLRDPEDLEAIGLKVLARLPPAPRK